MARDEKLGRRKPTRNPLKRMLIVCEGRKTESTYFADFRSYEGIQLSLSIEGGAGVPKTVVERAKELKHKAEKEARVRKDPNLKFDFVWCVFDVDEHPNIPDALQQAHANGVEVAISNPCFELWVLLHFKNQRAHRDRHAIQSDCLEFLPTYSKEVPFLKVHVNYHDALNRALNLCRWQTSRGCGRESNPWTEVHLLTEELLKHRPTSNTREYSTP